MYVCKFLVLVSISFFVANKSLHVQKTLFLVPAICYRFKNVDVANGVTRGSYEMANEDAE
jgi:hypothetical protein